jgi:hypothetical protein
MGIEYGARDEKFEAIFSSGNAAGRYRGLVDRLGLDGWTEEDSIRILTQRQP